jgi:Carboxypeptidase regulatory-like domain
MNLFLIKFVLAFAIVALIPFNAIGQAQEVQPSRGGEPRQSSAITGKVVNEGGQPLAGAFVQVREINSVRTNQTVVSGQNGVFRLEGLADSSYYLSAALPAYTPKRPPPNSLAPQYKIGDSVTIVLIRGGVVTGTVTNADGRPVVAIGVAALPVRTTGTRRAIGTAVIETATDDRGVYRIYGLPTGIYLIVADGTNDHSQIGVNAFSNDVPTYAPSASRDAAAEISVRAGEEIGNIDIRYRGERGRKISGTIAEMRGEEHFGAVLNAGSADGQRWQSKPSEAGSRSFAFEALADGDYYLTGISYLKGNDRALSETKLVSVRGADINGLELTPLPLGSIEGRVVLEETKAGECTSKTPLKMPDTFVAAWHRVTEVNKNKPPIIWSFGQPAKVDAQGNFRIRGLAPDEYHFQTRLTDKGWYLHSITFQSAQQGAKPLDATRVWTTLKSGEPLSGLTVTLAQGAASFTGKVALAEGEQPAERFLLYLVPADAERANDPLRFYAAPINDKGQVSFSNLAPGRYWVLTDQIPLDAGPSLLTKARLPDEKRARAALVRQGEAGKTQIELKPCQQMADFEIPRTAQP